MRPWCGYFRNGGEACSSEVGTTSVGIAAKSNEKLLFWKGLVPLKSYETQREYYWTGSTVCQTGNFFGEQFSKVY